MKTSKLLIGTVSALLLAFAFSPPASAVGSCSSFGLTTTCFYCQAGETLSVVVTGVSVTGSVSGCGKTASCSTGLSGSCRASVTLTSGFNGQFFCSVSLGGTAACTSA